MKQTTTSSDLEGTGENAYTIKSVAMSVRILREIAAAGGSLGVTQVARLLGESKARVHRHLLTLKDEGLLVQEDNDRYSLGWTLFDVGQVVASRFKITDVAIPHMRSLSNECGLSVMICLRDHHGLVVAESVDSERKIAVTVKKGLRFPAHASASGRVLLAHSPASFVAEVMDAELAAVTERTVTDPETLRKRLSEVKARGYDWAEGESQYGITTVSAPVLDNRGNLRAVLGVLGTQPQIGSPPTAELVGMLQACARRIGEHSRVD